MKLHKTTLAAGVGLGYVLGTKAGRERYEAIKKAAVKVADAPAVRQTANVVQVQAFQMTRSAAVKGKEAAVHAVESVRGRSAAEV
jgi:alpha-D-ribose 1-methylphosphonate 5-triphosphate synthase subunit PhnG